MTIDISQFFQVFFDEAEELLAEKERLLLAVDLAALGECAVAHVEALADRPSRTVGTNG